MRNVLLRHICISKDMSVLDVLHARVVLLLML
jgi:hypothetical protein